MRNKFFFVKNLESYLETRMQKILKNPNLLKNGRKLDNMINILPREEVGLFLVCAVGRFISKQNWRPASDHNGRDGVIIKITDNGNETIFATEQVYVAPHESGDLTELALSRIGSKSSKGSSYGKDRNLIVYCDKRGLLDHQRIKKEIEQNGSFDSFWLVGRISPIGWEYFVACPKTSGDPVMAYKVSLNDDFKGFYVESMGRL